MEFNEIFSYGSYKGGLWCNFFFGGGDFSKTRYDVFIALRKFPYTVKRISREWTYFGCLLFFGKYKVGKVLKKTCIEAFELEYVWSYDHIFTISFIVMK
jgi:hypothetical protein